MQLSLQHGEVKLMAADMFVGEQRSGMLCPNCKGGLHKDHSLSLTRTGSGVAFFCHRNKCNWKGHLPMIASVAEMTDRNKIPDYARKFYGKMEELPEKVAEQLYKKYLLTKESVARAGWIWCPEMDSGRIAMPIWNRFRYMIGHSFRTMDKRKLPKNKILITDPTCPMLCYYKSPKDVVQSGLGWTLPLVIVEDQISALRVSAYANAVALMGTNLSETKVLDIIKLKSPKVLLALDEDAKNTAIQYKKKYEELFPNGLDMVHLKYDLKDTSDEVIKEKLFV